MCMKTNKILFASSFGIQALIYLIASDIEFVNFIIIKQIANKCSKWVKWYSFKRKR